MKKNEAERSRASRLEHGGPRRLSHREIISYHREKGRENQSGKIRLEK